MTTTSNKRELLQHRAIDDIANKYYKEDAIFFGEYPTGAGKTKILLEAAEKIVKEKNISVIISTSNNALVFAIQKEAKKFGHSNVEVIIGKNNYVDADKVVSEEFLTKTGITFDVLAEYYKKRNTRDVLATEFVSDFNLDLHMEDEIKRDEFSSDNDISIIDKMITIANTPKVYVTNHYYLLSLYRIVKMSEDENEDIRPADRITLCPLLVDESHELATVAQTVYSSSFSPFRLSSMISTMMDMTVLPKQTKNSIKKVKTELRSLTTFFIKNNESAKSNFTFYSRARAFLESPALEQMRKSLAVRARNKKAEACDMRCRLMAGKILGEIAELRKVVLTEYDKVSITVSPIRKFGSIQTNTEEPSFSLRSMVWMKNRSFVCCVSGTFCVGEDISKEANKWSFLRLGFIPFKENINSDYPTVDNWNSRVKNKLVFKIEDPIFSKKQARYTILEEKRFMPPSYKEGEKVSSLTKAWIKNLAQEMAESLIYKNTVILMSSFENCQELKDELYKIDEIREDYAIFYSTPTVSARTLQEKYVKAIDGGKKAILIGNLTFYVGIDLPNQYLSTLIIGKLPFAPENKFISRFKVANAISRIMDNRNKAILTFRQGIGRGLRGEDDTVFLAICDPRILAGRNKNFLYFLDRFSVKLE